MPINRTTYVYIMKLTMTRTCNERIQIMEHLKKFKIKKSYNDNQLRLNNKIALLCREAENMC